MKNKVFLGKMVIVALALGLMIAPAANASLLSGYLTTDPNDANFGIVATAEWAGVDKGFKIDWEITPVMSGATQIAWHYSYAITNAYDGGALSKGLSHIILQVSDSAVLGDFSNFSPAYTDGDPQTYKYNPPSESNVNMPAPIYGFKFIGSSATTFTFSFDSVRNPMQGNFYARDGKSGGIDVTAWNTGLAGGNMFITVPDDSKVIPIPPTVWLMGSGLIGLAGLGWRRRRK